MSEGVGGDGRGNGVGVVWLVIGCIEERGIGGLGCLFGGYISVASETECVARGGERVEGGGERKDWGERPEDDGEEEEEGRSEIVALVLRIVGGVSGEGVVKEDACQALVFLEWRL